MIEPHHGNYVLVNGKLPGLVRWNYEGKTLIYIQDSKNNILVRTKDMVWSNKNDLWEVSINDENSQQPMDSGKRIV